ncbi:MAG: hypothetical protein WAP03_01765 [Methylorubrum rhodinum]
MRAVIARRSRSDPGRDVVRVGRARDATVAADAELARKAGRLRSCRGAGPVACRALPACPNSAA